MCFQKDNTLIPITTKIKNIQILEILKILANNSPGSYFEDEIDLDKTPDKICSQCLKKIENVIELIELCKKSAESFKFSSEPDIYSLEKLYGTTKFDDESPETSINSSAPAFDESEDSLPSDKFFKKTKPAVKTKGIDFSKINVDQIVKKRILNKPRPEAQRLVCHRCGKVFK